MAPGEARATRRARVSRPSPTAAPPTEFTGYETLEQRTEVLAVSNGYAKLAESPFYAEGGGQISDTGTIECLDGGCRAAVTGVIRVGDDQALVLDGTLPEGARVVARVGPERRATECNHTATHLLHAALREILGAHVRQAGSYVGPDKLRFDFTHGAPLTPDEVRAVEDRVNEEILANRPVRAITTTLEEARRARRDGAVRREVRRRRADGQHRRRRVVARAVRRHARALDRRDRRLQDHHRVLERGQRAPHRGRDRRRRGRAAASPRSPARSRRRRRSRPGPSAWSKRPQRRRPT